MLARPRLGPDWDWEMTGAMLVPTAAAVALLGLTAMDEVASLMVIEHVGMVVAMLGAMLLRVDEYAHRATAYGAI